MPRVMIDVDNRLNDRIVVLTTRTLKDDFYRMCVERALNPSEFVREFMIKELEAYGPGS
jgi:hypothetical protein